ncbi:peptidoglycan-binding protein [Nonomuraea indica]|uniref:peptidoglycan-binding protein n=1 Tax=Nonomuraea indica TaxID=1581193 RepID=UPI001FE8A819|nr:peptidoglycan-binding protein [Nonomuraea indica]
MAIDIVSRRDWGARAPRGGYTRLDSTRGVKVHYTGGRVDPGIVGDHDLCVSLVRSIQRHHMDGNGWMDIGYCVDEETEILTQQGWKSHRDLQVGDLALTLNHDIGVSEWQPVLEVCVFPARRREMIRMKGASHSSLTTPQHRWPVERLRRRTGTRWQRGPDGSWLPTGAADRVAVGYERMWVTTETLGHWDRIPIAAPCADLATEPKWSDAFVELVAWFWTEGHIMSLRGGRPATSVALYQAATNPANVARIRAALTEVFGPACAAFPRVGGRTDGIPRWREATNRNLVEFHLSADAGRRLIEVAPDRVPAQDFLLTLTRAQLSLFIETSLAADNAGKDKLAQKNRAAAEAFMLAVILAGHGASLRRRPPTATCKSDMWLVNIRKQRNLTPRSAALRGASFAIIREVHDGVIWCPRTANHSWLARREGTVYFTGNTYIGCPHKKVFEGRGLHRLPAANGSGLNSAHYAVLGLVGNAGLVQPPDGVLHAVLDAIEHLRERGGAGREIKGHRDGYSTDCPGEPLYAWVRRGAPRPGGDGGGDGDGPGAPPFPGRLLRYPPVTRGEDVRTWQRQMRTRGWDIAVDGAYGSASRDVCRRFQRQQGVEDDGVVGPVTWRLAWEAPRAAGTADAPEAAEAREAEEAVEAVGSVDAPEAAEARETADAPEEPRT